MLRDQFVTLSFLLSPLSVYVFFFRLCHTTFLLTRLIVTGSIRNALFSPLSPLLRTSLLPPHFPLLLPSLHPGIPPQATSLTYRYLPLLAHTPWYPCTQGRRISPGGRNRRCCRVPIVLLRCCYSVALMQKHTLRRHLAENVSLALRPSPVTYLPLFTVTCPYDAENVSLALRPLGVAVGSATDTLVKTSSQVTVG